MIRNLRYRVDGNETVRRVRRFFDTGIGNGRLNRRLIAALCGAAIILLYCGPSLLRWLFSDTAAHADPQNRCLDERLAPFLHAEQQFNVHIRRYGADGRPTASTAAGLAGGGGGNQAGVGAPALLSMGASSAQRQERFVPYVGNGLFGLVVDANAHLMIKAGRSLALPVNFHPIISVVAPTSAAASTLLRTAGQSASVVDYRNGVVHRFQCFEEGLDVAYDYYAHRRMPNVLVQEIRINNPRNVLIDVQLQGSRISDWSTAVTQTIKLQHGSTILDYQVVTGRLQIVAHSTRPLNYKAVSIVYRKLPRTITLKKRAVTRLEFLLTIHSSEAITIEEYARVKDATEQTAIEAMRHALLEAEHRQNDGSFRRSHTDVWQALWATGFEISASLAEDSINGDRINATMYAVLSHARSIETEANVTALAVAEQQAALNAVEGCYDSYHTLQAEDLWVDMRTLEELNGLVATWMLTLEKQGCHKLLRAGAAGVVQAMVLSLGGFRFSNQHLELNIHPRYLHRDYVYRRINYGNSTHINISVAVTADNKAVLWVALDRERHSVRPYFACDAGCLDAPVELGPTRTQFPVKLTEPLTAILYIASDRDHIEELRHAIHVKEVAEAPAHEHHVIALHRHGHQLGGLPTLFWISICVIIVVFHVFLCKLIVKEYCEPPDKRYRYSKP